LSRTQFSIVLFIGTQKGLFILRSDSHREYWTLDGPYMAGYEIAHAWLDPRDGKTGYAATYHVVWGPHIYRTEDGGASWNPLSVVPHHGPGEYDNAIKSIWNIAAADPQNPAHLYAGIDPPGLFVSRDRGESWNPVLPLNRHSTRARWEPARGIFALHSICVDPRDAKRVFAAVSAGGVYRSEDRGESWEAANRGVRVTHLPEPFPEAGHNVHRILLHPAQPTRLYRQCYSGTYRSDDSARTWVDITEGLPSDFGYAIAIDPHDPDVIFQIPEESSHMRAAVEGKLRVYRSNNAGRNWQALTNGLPQQHAYVSVLREAMDSDGLEPCGVYFGTTSGHLFATRDGGEHWREIAAFLPRILSVKATIVA
jgi:photosystem II stability/assembly factor-like uncharacterized protein